MLTLFLVFAISYADVAGADGTIDSDAPLTRLDCGPMSLSLLLNLTVHPAEARAATKTAECMIVF